MSQNFSTAPNKQENLLWRRLEELALATDVSSIDMTAFYSPDDVMRMLGLDVRTGERRRETNLPPAWIPVGKSIRYPALLFWAWVLSELRGCPSSFQKGMREQAPCSQ